MRITNAWKAGCLFVGTLLLALHACWATEVAVNMPLLSAPPYGWLDTQGKAQGLYPDIARALARITGLDIRVEVVPFARAASQVANGAADATLMFSNAFTAGYVNEARVVFYANQVVQLRPGLAVYDRRGLMPLTLGRINGGCQELSEDVANRRKFQDLNTQESGVRMLLAKRIDGFCTTTEALAFAIGSENLASQFRDTQVLELASKPVWLMLSRKLPQGVAKRLEEAVRQLQESGELARIFKARLGSGYALRLPK